MSKYQRLTKRIAKTGIIAVVIIGGFGAVYAGLAYYAAEAAQQKADAKSKYEQDTNLLTTLRDQYDKSGLAQQRYTLLAADRNSLDFSGTLDAMKEYLRNAKTRYHFDKVNFRPQKDVLSDKPELANFNYSVYLQPHISVQFLAASDMHVFSFIDDLRRSAPGLVRIDSVTIKRTSDMTDANLAQIPAGATPLLVDATIEFTWFHVTLKDSKDQKNNPNPAPAP